MKYFSSHQQKQQFSFNKQSNNYDDVQLDLIYSILVL